MADHTVDSAIEASSVITSAAAKTTVVGGGASVAGKFLGIDPITAIGLIVGVGGLLVSLMGFLVNLHFKRLDEKRKREIHELEVKQLKGECNAK